MPEGPEIALEADKIRAALEGQGVRAGGARGEAMLIHFDNDLAIDSRNQLYGKWFVRRVDPLHTKPGRGLVPSAMPRSFERTGSEPLPGRCAA